MTLNFDNESSTDLHFEPEELAEQVIEASLEVLNCPFEAEVNLLLTTAQEVHELNKRFRGIDRTTDVLSFPMLEFEAEGNFSFLNDESDADSFNPLTGELLLGDIVINSEQVIRQAEEYGHSVRREYAFLITHSMLHLTGYDHMEEDEALRMREKQREILEKLEILR